MQETRKRTRAELEAIAQEIDGLLGGRSVDWKSVRVSKDFVWPWRQITHYVSYRMFRAWIRTDTDTVTDTDTDKDTCDGTGTGTRIPELLLIERAPHFKMTKGKNQQS